jgi:hypothetical protein
LWNIFHKYKVFLWNRYHSKQIVLENEAEAKAEVKVEVKVEVEVEVEVEAEVEAENSPYKTYKNIEDKVASKMNQILCKQSGSAECTQIIQ